MARKGGSRSEFRLVLVNSDGLQLYFIVCCRNADSFIRAQNITGLGTATEQFVMISSWVCTMKHYSQHYELRQKQYAGNFCEVIELYFLD